VEAAATVMLGTLPEGERSHPHPNPLPEGEGQKAGSLIVVLSQRVREIAANLSGGSLRGRGVRSSGRGQKIPGGARLHVAERMTDNLAAFFRSTGSP
jgi:hypothetical protein